VENKATQVTDQAALDQRVCHAIAERLLSQRRSVDAGDVINVDGVDVKVEQRHLTAVQNFAANSGIRYNSTVSFRI
jgi:hypothetical protein